MSRGGQVASDVARLGPDVQRVVIPHRGHYIAEEAPDAFLATVWEFLADAAVG